MTDWQRVRTEQFFDIQRNANKIIEEMRKLLLWDDPYAPGSTINKDIDWTGASQALSELTRLLSRATVHLAFSFEDYELAAQRACTRAGLQFEHLKRSYGELTVGDLGEGVYLRYSSDKDNKGIRGTGLPYQHVTPGEFEQLAYNTLTTGILHLSLKTDNPE
jgi:hypothetical protein